jgi:D-aminoacyl-tRNA deacylase
MIAVVQRVSRAEVRVAEEVVGKIAGGFLALVGVRLGDTAEDARILADRVSGLRVFEDDEGKMNRSLKDTGLSLLAVSQFTLCADLRRGRRPSFDRAAPPPIAQPLFDRFCGELRAAGLVVETGRFGASMQVELVNSGPATFVLDSAWWNTADRPGDPA